MPETALSSWCFVLGFPQGHGPAWPQATPRLTPPRQASPICSSPQPSNLVNGVDEHAGGSHSSGNRVLFFPCFPQPSRTHRHTHTHTPPQFPTPGLWPSPQPRAVLEIQLPPPNSPKPSLMAPHTQLSPSRDPRGEEGPAFFWKVVLGEKTLP